VRCPANIFNESNVELFKNFLDNHESCPILKDQAIIEDGTKTGELFLSNFREQYRKF